MVEPRMMEQTRELVFEGRQMSKQVLNNLVFVSYLLVSMQNQGIYKQKEVS